MRVFVLLRSIFFVVLLTAITIFVAHSQLCINYTPQDLEGVMERCERSFNSISAVSNDLNVTDEDTKHLIETMEGFYNKSRGGLEDVEDAVNVTVIDDNSTFHQIPQWHKVSLQNEMIRVNVRTCFNFTIHHIFGSLVQKYTEIVAPLRLTIILIITSFLLAILDLSSRVILHTISLAQCLAHSFAQVVLWGYILVNIEIYRRSWPTMWLTAGQSSTEIPMYPSEWLAFELHAFSVIMLSIMDAVLFKYLSRRVRLLNSEGVYKCIQPENKLDN